MMIPLAIAILWLCIGIVILGAVIWILLMVIRRFVPIAPNIEFAVWAVFGILILIYLLMAVEGGTLPHPGLGALR